MFTGIVEEIGEVRGVARSGDVLRLDLAARATLEGSGLGASVAVNGVCLTVVAARPDGLAFEVGPETLTRTTLGALKVGHAGSLEGPLRFGAAVGGHLVLGQVDGIGAVTDVARVESTARVRIALPGPALAPLLVEQGSVAVDGVSLTIAALSAAAFEVMVIPHTLAVTTFGRLTAGRGGDLLARGSGQGPERSLPSHGGPRNGSP